MIKQIWIVATSAFGVAGSIATAGTGAKVSEGEAAALKRRGKCRLATLDEIAEFEEAATLAALEAAEADADQLRDDGPTIAEFVAAGYPAKHYPPEGYAPRSTAEEIAAAIAEQADAKAAKAQAAPKPGTPNGKAPTE